MFIVQEEFQVYLSNISNKDLICDTCVNATDSVTTCRNFERRKPCSVFYDQCMEYIKKNDIEKA